MYTVHYIWIIFLIINTLINYIVFVKYTRIIFHFIKRYVKFYDIKLKKKCVAYPQEDFLFIKLLTSFTISLLNKCKKGFQFHIKTTESKFFYTKYKIFFTWLIRISRFWAFMTSGCISDPIKYTFLSSA
jgi:hypothetical protein